MYILKYHSSVADDIKALGASDKKRIKNAIETKLVEAPVQFGKPLQYSLRGLRSLRVGDHRVVFQISENEVLIILIAHRSVVYKTAQKRGV